MNLEVDNPVPAITQFVPSSFTTGAASTTLSVIGTGFVPTTALQVNGSVRSTAFVSPTQVNVILGAADLATAGSLPLVAANAQPGGGTSASASVPINNPVPTLTALAPSSAVAGTATSTTVAVTGTSFLPNSTVQVGTSPRATTFVSPTQLTFALTVADQATAGRLAISVRTPSPGGGTSAVLSLPVVTPTPTPALTSVNPSTLIAGSPATSIVVQGSSFTPGSVVQWNGTPLTTTYYFSTSLYASVPASLLAAVGTASITVTPPTAIVPLSNALSVSITDPPVPTLSAITPNFGPINAATAVTITGTGFTTGSTVAYNGSALSTTYKDSTSLSATLPASANALPGNGSFTVSTPAPGGGSSAAQIFSAYIPLVSNSMVYNPADGLVYASIGGSAGAPLGNSIVSVNPATGALGTPIFVGSEPDKLALTADGKYLWVTLDGSSGFRKVDLIAKTAGPQFSVAATNSGIYNPPPSITALVALPGATDSVVLSTINANAPSIYDNGVLRGTTTTSTLQQLVKLCAAGRCLQE